MTRVTRPNPRATLLKMATTKSSTSVVASLPALLSAFLFVGGQAAGPPPPQLTGAIIAPGMVKVDQNLKSIQHRDGGIISEIAVKEGDFVTKGQVMLRLDDAADAR